MPRGEIGLLAQSIDLMISALKEREFERMASEKSIRQLNKRNQLILNTARARTVGIDAAGVVIFVNLVAYAMTGYVSDERLGQNLRQMTHPFFSDGSYDPLALCPMFQPVSVWATNQSYR